MIMMRFRLKIIMIKKIRIEREHINKIKGI
jgi:hypothetical protein